MTEARLFAAAEATWSPAQRVEQDGWILRRGDGGGKRVSAATSGQPGVVPDIAAAERGMAAMGQPPLFMLRPGDSALDEELDKRGYHIIDPVIIMTATAADVAALPDDPLAAIECTAPLAVMADIWAAGGISDARLNVMRRSGSARVFMLGRARDHAAGCAFAAIDGTIALIHALEVAKDFRRAGAARQMVEKASFWAVEQGATEIGALTVETNTASRALFRGMGFQDATRYHYRTKEQPA